MCQGRLVHEGDECGGVGLLEGELFSLREIEGVAELNIVGEIHPVELFPCGVGILEDRKVVFLGVGKVSILSSFGFLEDAVHLAGQLKDGGLSILSTAFVTEKKELLRQCIRKIPGEISRGTVNRNLKKVRASNDFNF